MTNFAVSAATVSNAAARTHAPGHSARERPDEGGRTMPRHNSALDHGSKAPWHRGAGSCSSFGAILDRARHSGLLSFEAHGELVLDRDHTSHIFRDFACLSNLSRVGHRARERDFALLSYYGDF